MIAKKTVPSKPQQDQQLGQNHPDHLDRLDPHQKGLHHQHKLSEPVRAQGMMNHPLVGRQMYGHPKMIGQPTL